MKKTKVSKENGITFCIYCRMLVLFFFLCGNFVLSQIYSISDVVISGSDNLYVENSQKNLDVKIIEISHEDETVIKESRKTKLITQSLSKQEKRTPSFTKKSVSATKQLFKEIEDRQRHTVRKQNWLPQNPDSFFCVSNQNIDICVTQNYQSPILFESKSFSSSDSRNYKTTPKNFGETFFLYGKNLFYSFSVRPPPFLFV